MSDILAIVNQGVSGDNAMLLTALVLGYVSKHLKDRYSKKEQDKPVEIAQAGNNSAGIMDALSRIEEKIDGLSPKKAKLLTEATADGSSPRRGRPKKLQQA